MKVGELLVIIGVAGELLADGGIFVLSNKLQIISDQEIGEAKQSAGAAFERAAQTEKEAAEDLKATNVAGHEAEEARQKAEGFQLQIAQANERAAEAERETARLKSQLADRTLTDDQLRAIAIKLASYAGQEYEIVAYWDSKESVGIANRIHQALQMARWKYIPPPKTGVALFGGVIGIFVNVHPEADRRVKEAATALVSALNEQAVAAELRDKNDPGHPDQRITFSIGSKR